MYPENIKRRLEYKLRELELIIKQISRDPEVSDIDIELALEKTGQLYDLLYRLQPGTSPETGKGRQPVPTGRPVVASDPDPVENNNIYEAEGIIPSPSGSMKHERPGEAQDPDAARPVDEGKEGTSQGPKSENKEKPAPPVNFPAAHITPVKEEQGPGEKGVVKAEGSTGTTGEVPQGKTLEASQKPEPPVTGEENARSEKFETGKPGQAGKKHDRPPDIEIIADKYQSSQNYINQAIASKQARKDLTTRLQSRPISDLKSSIGLNDKFLFIKELFNGSPEKYNQCVEDLNMAATYEEALHTAKTKYSLDEKSDVVKRLLVLVKRKIQNV
jgi:hypothetical protein